MVFIDRIGRLPEENAVIITGWDYDEKTEKAHEIEIDADQEIEELIGKRDIRLDVVNYYELEEVDDLGFSYKIKLDDLSGKLYLHFKNPKTGEIDETVTLNFDKRLCHPKEIDKTKQALTQMFNEYTSYFKSGNGVRYLINKVKKQLPGMDPTYANWINKFEHEKTPEEVAQILEELKYKPTISILMPVYKVELDYLKKAIDSVRTQSYPYWELSIAEDHSEDQEIVDYLKQVKEEDHRIRVIFRNENGNISRASNTAYKNATGEWIALMDDDDVLAKDALLENVIYINEHPGTELIYSDEDKLSEKNEIRETPYFKPDFSPDTIMTNNYICHFLMFKRSLLNDKELPFRPEYDGAQDHDLILRLIERTEGIGHIPKILYHWRIIPSSTSQNFENKSYAEDAGKRAIEDAIKRRGYSGTVKPTIHGGFYEVTYDIQKPGKVSIIIPTKNNSNDLRNCVASIVAKTTYPDYEILIVDNGSDKKKDIREIDKIAETYKDHVRVLRLPIPFNYSRINNIAAKEAKGDYYVFLNDDTKVITKGWITKMVGYAEKPWIGCVGVKLLYPNLTIQHAGVIVGILGIAGHVFSNYPRQNPGYFTRIQTEVNYTAVTAACLMIEKKKFWEVGGFDENIAVAFNDVDLCCKVADAGYYNIYLGTVELIHYESQSRGYETTPTKKMRFEKEKSKIVRKWRPFIFHDPMYNPNLTLLRGDYGIKN